IEVRGLSLVGTTRFDVVVGSERHIEFFSPVRVHVAKIQGERSVLIRRPSFKGRRHALALVVNPSRLSTGDNGAQKYRDKRHSYPGSSAPQRACPHREFLAGILPRLVHGSGRGRRAFSHQGVEQRERRSLTERTADRPVVVSLERLATRRHLLLELFIGEGD